MDSITTTINLDIYDHDTSPSVIKTIALDRKTRFVQAYLQEKGEIYQPAQNDVVELVAIRPDGVGVMSTGSVVLLDAAFETNPDIYGVRAEITQAMLAVSGNIKLQFRLSNDINIIRTEIFTANNGVALDGSTNMWAGEYDGHNIDEFVRGHKVTRIRKVTEEEYVGLTDEDFETTLYIVKR